MAAVLLAVLAVLAVLADSPADSPTRRLLSAPLNIRWVLISVRIPTRFDTPGRGRDSTGDGRLWGCRGYLKSANGSAATLSGIGYCLMAYLGPLPPLSFRFHVR